MSKIFEKLKIVLRRHGIVFLLYFLLTLVFSSFLLPVFFTHIPGQPGDTIDSLHKIAAPMIGLKNAYIQGVDAFLEHLWDIKFSIVDLRFYSSLPTLFLSDIATYNVVWMFSFFFAALFTYVLVLHLSKSRLVAFLSGVLFSFAPFHFAYANGFSGAIHVEIIPLYLFALILFLEKFSWRRFAFVVLCFGSMLITEHHFGYFGLLFSVPVVAYYLHRRYSHKRVSKDEIKKYAWSTGMLFVAAVAFALPYLEVAFSGNNYLRVDIDELIANSLDLFHFITPSLHHMFWGDFFAENIWVRLEEAAVVEKHKHFSEVSGYVTFVGLFFSGAALFLRKKIKSYSDVAFWALLVCSIFIISMGPFLSILGPIVPVIPLPAILLYEYLPFMDNIRTIGRIFPFGMISFVIVFAFGLSYFIKKFDRKWHFAFISVVGLILIVELVQLPPVIAIEVPGIVQHIEDDDGEFTVLNLNGSYCYLCQNNFKYYNSLHGKDILGGMWFGRQGPAERFTVEKTTPFIKEILYNVSLGEDLSAGVFRHNYDVIALHMLEEEGVGYLLYDTRFFLPEDTKEKNNDPVPRPSTFRKMHSTLISFDGIELYKSEKGMVSYRVERPTSPKDYMLLRQPKTELNHFVRNNGTGEEYIPFEDGNTLQLENYTEDDVYVKMQLSATNDAPVHITYADRTFELDVTQARRWYGFVLPKTENEIEMLDFGIGDEVEVRAHSIYYEATSNTIDLLDEKLTKDAVSVVSYDDSAISGFMEKELGFNFPETQEAILYGVLDWDAIARNRDVYASDYFRAQLYNELKAQNINPIVFEKFNQAFTDAYSNFVQIDIGLMNIKEDVGQFVVYQLNNLEDVYPQERLEAPLIYFLYGVGGLQINPEGLEQQPIYSYRNVESEFVFGSFDEVVTETNLSFELYPSQLDFSLDDYQIEVIDKDGERVRSIPFSRKVSIGVLGSDFQFSIKDSEGNLLEIKEGQSIALYNLDFK